MINGKSLHRSAISVAMLVAYCNNMVYAGEKLDMSFIHGGANLTQDMWSIINGNYVPGSYLVDVSLNGKTYGKQILVVTKEDQEKLCLTDDWLSKSGIYIKRSYFKDVYDSSRNCYVLNDKKLATVDFDVSTQSLSFLIPQIGITEATENIEWDYGTSAFRINYNINANRSQSYSSTFGSADLKANIGTWVINSTANASSGHNQNDATINMFTATRAIRTLSADLAVGRTFIGDNLLGSEGSYGISLSKNNSMKPGRLGYTPVFSGVADGPSRVTLTQNGRNLYSEMMPGGAFSITNVPIYSSGDVTMRIVDDNGRERIQVFPLSVVGGQVSPGDNEFNLAFGMPDDDSALKGGIVSASYGYGFDKFTLRTSGIFNHDWFGSSIGLISGLGNLGAVSIDGSFTRSTYRDTTTNGNKFQMSWSKQIEATSSGLRVSWSRQSEDYESLSSFDPSAMWTQRFNVRNIKNELNIGISQQIGDMNISASGWQRSYYPWRSHSYNNINGKTSGVTGMLNTRINGVGLNFGVSGSKNSMGENSWSVSSSVSVPFTLFEKRYSSSSQISNSKGGNTSFSTGISGSLNDRFSYGVGSGRDSNGEWNSYLNASYASDWSYMSGMLNHYSSGTSGSISASGSVITTPAAKDILFSKTTGETVAIVNVKDTPGVKVTSGNGATDTKGNLVVPLNSYDWNTVTIDASSLPLNTELTTTSLKVVPVDKAVIWMPFDTLKVRRYLLQVKQNNGDFVPGGTWARDDKHTPLGFVANNGLLMINAVDALGDINLGQCRIPESILQDTEKLQEVVCEK